MTDKEVLIAEYTPGAPELELRPVWFATEMESAGNYEAIGRSYLGPQTSLPLLFAVMDAQQQYDLQEFALPTNLQTRPDFNSRDATYEVEIVFGGR